MHKSIPDAAGAKSPASTIPTRTTDRALIANELPICDRVTQNPALSKDGDHLKYRERFCFSVISRHTRLLLPRLPITGQLFSFGHLLWGHLGRDSVQLFSNIAVLRNIRDAQPHAGLDIVLRHSTASGVHEA